MRAAHVDERRRRFTQSIIIIDCRRRNLCFRDRLLIFSSPSSPNHQRALLRQRRVGVANRSQRRVDEPSAEFIGRHAVQKSHVVLSRGEQSSFKSSFCALSIDLTRDCLFRPIKHLTMAVVGLTSYPFHISPPT
jgi:hypothetical protein